MASTITITCPECDKQIKAPAEVAGKKVRCKGCGATFLARAPGKAPAGKAPPRKRSQEDEDDSPYGIAREENASHRCPECANELESEDAVVCLRCGYNTVTRTRARTRKVRDVTGGDVFKWLLPGILCAVGVVFLIVFNLLFALTGHRWVDQDAWYSFLTGKAAKVWLAVPSLVFVYAAGKFAIHRLIFDNKPPEIEENL
jgi:DNA-directed RNA polymerase subunit RPC12/RpoP